MNNFLKLIVKKDPKSPVSEAYRDIRTNIKFANIDRDVKKILVTSSVASEGKSTTISNLACTLADDDNKVLVIDCDLRKPTIHKKFSIRNNRGLTDILVTKEDYTDYKQKIYDRLDIITSGRIPSNPSEILGSNSMKQLLQIVENDYDYILIDSAPISAVTDSLIISSYVDGVIIVIEAGKTPIEIVKNSVEKLRNVSANIIGTILNNVEINSRNNMYYYSYSRYMESE